MSFLNASQPLQSFLNGYGNRGRTWSVIDYIMRTSLANTRINLDNESFLQAPGKKRKAKINYVPVQCDVDGACGQGLCTTGTVIEPVQRDLEITQCTATKKYRLRHEDIRLTDNGAWDVNGYAIGEMLSSIMPEFRRNIALDMLTRLYALSGIHPDGTASKRLPLTVNQTSSIPTPVGLWNLEREYTDAGFMQPNILGGGSDFYNMRKAVEIGGLDQNGLYLNRIPTDNTWYDDGLQRQLFNDVANGDWVVAVDPQMFKMVTYLQNVGQFATALTDISNLDQLYKGRTGPGHDFIKATVTDRVTGLTMDVFINYDKCDDAWDMHLELQWDFFVMPPINCGVEGVNGIMVYRTCPELEIPCPTGTPVTPPAAPTARNWNPTFTYPKPIYAVNIGGKDVTYTEPVTLTSDADTVALLNNSYGAPVFTLVGSDIRYTGYTNLSGNLNNGEIAATFA